MVNATFSAVENKQQGVVHVFKMETATAQVWLMYLQVKMPENGTKNVFREMKTRKNEQLKVVDVKVLTER